MQGLLQSELKQISRSSPKLAPGVRLASFYALQWSFALWIFWAHDQGNNEEFDYRELSLVLQHICWSRFFSSSLIWAEMIKSVGLGQWRCQDPKGTTSPACPFSNCPGAPPSWTRGQDPISTPPGLYPTLTRVHDPELWISAPETPQQDQSPAPYSSALPGHRPISIPMEVLDAWDQGWGCLGLGCLSPGYPAAAILGFLPTPCCTLTATL